MIRSHYRPQREALARLGIGTGHGLLLLLRPAQSLLGSKENSNGLLRQYLAETPTCAALADLAPSVLVPAHCTGWRATHALAARLPTAFIQNSVGTSYQF